MAGYTTPKTWISSDLESVVDWNTYVRDDENSIRQFMYLPSQYSAFQFNLSAGANIVYTSPDLLLAAPAEGWTFYVMAAMGIWGNAGATTTCTIVVKDRAGTTMTGLNIAHRVPVGTAAHTPQSILKYITYANAGVSQIPKYSITITLASGTSGHVVGLAYPYAVPLAQ